jgi:hypothetical protein
MSFSRMDSKVYGEATLPSELHDSAHHVLLRSSARAWHDDRKHARLDRLFRYVEVCV